MLQPCESTCAYLLNSPGTPASGPTVWESVSTPLPASPSMPSCAPAQGWQPWMIRRGKVARIRLKQWFQANQSSKSPQNNATTPSRPSDGPSAGGGSGSVPVDVQTGIDEMCARHSDELTRLASDLGGWDRLGERFGQVLGSPGPGEADLADSSGLCQSKAAQVEGQRGQS